MAASSVIVLLKGDHDENAKDPYSEHLKTLNLQPVIIPILQFQFINLEELSASLKRDYSGIVFTSQRAVEAVTCAMSILSGDEREVLSRKWRSKLTFVVGEATALAAETSLGFDTIGKESGNAEALVPVILRQLIPCEGPKSLLFPCGNLRKDTISSGLQSKDIRVEEIVSYQSICHPDLLKNIEKLFFEKGTPDIFVYFSPSGVKFSLPIIKDVGLKIESIKDDPEVSWLPHTEIPFLAIYSQGK
ncbi:uroporphyrinogen-III synthase-like isoform X2 [Limulus polyphemus]|uniref:Uroporphyrinogen-III synthase-like isoform X2 n=1 Tax=Limulus polyphemus TaxID=6850 RepID=A0ABM1B5D9_LIMPO|nr:uroporphyrinogen-III synthase-like isoform X2 [Limulus polyphemus]